MIDPESKFRTFIRDDYGMRCFLTTKLGGPKWSDVVSRTTFNIDDGRMIEHLQVEKGVNAAVLHRPLPNGVSNIRTVLQYIPMEAAQAALEKEVNSDSEDMSPSEFENVD